MKFENSVPATPTSLIHSIARGVAHEYEAEFGVVRPDLAHQCAVDYVDLEHNASWRFELIRKHLPHANRVLDLSSGYGTAVWSGLAKGYWMVGLEPSAQKQSLAQDLGRIFANGLSQAPLVRGLGEYLPFKPMSFDVITSYQTLEHVQNPKAVLMEMIRITRSGGGIHLRCPDYSGTYEGHYLLPWLPLLPRPLARIWLRLCRRPTRGLNGIVYVTVARVLQWLQEIERHSPGLQLKLIDLEKERVCATLTERGIPILPGVYALYRLRRFFTTAFRQEKPLHLWIGIQKPQISTFTT